MFDLLCDPISNVTSQAKNLKQRPTGPNFLLHPAGRLLFSRRQSARASATAGRRRREAHMDGGTRRRVLGAARLAAFGLAGCVSSPYSCAAKEAARPDAAKVMADAPALLPAQPVSSTAATRGQAADPAPAGGVTQAAARIRAVVNGVPILEEELREATAQYASELLAVPEVQRGEVLQKIADRELQRLIERELVLDDAFSRLKQQNQTKIIQKLQEEGSKEADKRIRDIKTSLKVATDEEMKAILQNQGLTVAGIRRQVERNSMMMDYVRNLIFPMIERISLQQIREYYEQHPGEFQLQDRVRWQDIFIDAS